MPESPAPLLGRDVLAQTENKLLHQAFHLGREKTEQTAQKIFTKKNLSRTVQQVVLAYEVCLRNMPLNN